MLGKLQGELIKVSSYRDSILKVCTYVIDGIALSTHEDILLVLISEIQYDGSLRELSAAGQLATVGSGSCDSAWQSTAL